MDTCSSNAYGSQVQADQFEETGISASGLRDICAGRVEALAWLDEIGIGLAAGERSIPSPATKPNQAA